MCFFCAVGLLIEIIPQANAGFGFTPSDPYHTYLSLAALSMFPPPLDKNDPIWASWNFEALDPLINARVGTAKWAKERVAIQRNGG